MNTRLSASFMRSSGAYELVGTAPAAFTLLTPADGAQLSTPTLKWTASAGAQVYVVKVKRQSNGKKMFKEKLTPAQLNCVTECSLTLTGVKLKPGKDYTWKVTAKNAFGKAKGGKRSFTAG